MPAMPSRQAGNRPRLTALAGDGSLGPLAGETIVTGPGVVLKVRAASSLEGILHRRYPKSKSDEGHPFDGEISETPNQACKNDWPVSTDDVTESHDHEL